MEFSSCYHCEVSGRGGVPSGGWGGNWSPKRARTCTSSPWGLREEWGWSSKALTLVFNARPAVWCQPAASPIPRGTLRCLWCSSTCSVPQLGLTRCDPKDSSPPGSSVPGIFQARILEWAAVSSSRGSFLPRVQTHISCVSCIGRWILYHCAPWEAPSKWVKLSPLTGTPITQLSWSLSCGTRGWE